MIRVLDSEEIVDMCKKLGFKKEYIIAKRGPFSFDENMFHFSIRKNAYLITKDGGSAGGYDGYLNAKYGWQDGDCFGSATASRA